MPPKNLTHFRQLKLYVTQQLQSVHPHIETVINDWRGQEIQLFQADLMDKVQGRVSEKWFYTHLKPLKNEKLPRIDMLNLLCRYVGFEGWQDFLKIEVQKSDMGISENEKAQIEGLKISSSKQDQGFLFTKYPSLKAIVTLSIGLIVALWLLGSSWMSVPQKKYEFCFVDGDSGKPIEGDAIEVVILHEKESPMTKTCDEKGCLEMKGKMEQVKMVVKATYYRNDTIVRILNKQQRREEIRLQTDDYALMIHIFSTSKLEDWQKRRAQLNDMISEKAQFIQVDAENRLGMEIYNKNDFVDKLTMPIKSLKNIKVLETQYNSKGKIVSMRFIQTN